MAKSAERLKARAMRRGGESIIVISKKLGVSKSSASLWCQDIELTPHQIKNLLERKEDGLKRGQLMGAMIQRQKRLQKVEAAMKNGAEYFRNLERNTYLSAGLALYLGEGAKTKRKFYFVNSDPRIIRFMMLWLRDFFDVSDDRFHASVLINEIHKSRESDILNFWSQYLHISMDQFHRTTYVHSTQKKRYENHDKYYGVFRLAVLKSTDLYYKIAGLMEGLLQHVPRPA